MSLKAALLNRLKGWRFSGTPAQGETLPHWPCNYWQICRNADGLVTLRDPQYGGLKSFRVYSGVCEGNIYSFAFEEVSNGVFAVFERV